MKKQAWPFFPRSGARQSPLEPSFTDYFPQETPQKADAPARDIETTAHEWARNTGDMFRDLRLSIAASPETSSNHSTAVDPRSYTRVVAADAPRTKKNEAGSGGAETSAQLENSLAEAVIPPLPSSCQNCAGRAMKSDQDEWARVATSYWPLVWLLTVLFFLGVITTLCFTLKN